ncbi:hypothetical protein GCM10008090_29800 [Arenicella chitinivorans]|uniref:Aminoglycoside phosphotransferase domain-containing protein n=1 Tax=Arenicella chitinivorans TaxID=1329800 RepID=A0A918S121_9GAMM|nr:phosphotransferase [Arenicella chitinivorans]GHA18258.1 hypothetical protein GCM10008090_29800 [Arenicella chitinivorans]
MQPSNLLANWRRWGLTAQPKIVEQFTAGQNHQTVLLQSADEFWVLKQFSHSFDLAISAQRWAAAQGLAPKIHFADDDVALMAYQESVPFAGHHIKLLAQALHKLHSAPEPTTFARFDLIEFCQQYLANLEGALAEQATSIHRGLANALHSFAQDATPWCVCHNDLVISNCLFEAKRVWFIDWEYTMLHNPWFDLAAIVLYFELDSQQSQHFLAHYAPGWEAKQQTPIFLAAQIALLWGDLLWHLSKYGTPYLLANPSRFTQLDDLTARFNTLAT